MDIRVRRAIGGAVWVAGFGVAVVWGSLANYGAEGKGYGFSPPVLVSALETGKVERLPVGLHAQVGAEDVVVEFDTAPLVDEREWAAARLEAARELASYQRSDDERRFNEGVGGVLFDRARVSIQLQEDKAALNALQERLSVELDLAQSGASSGQAVEEWRRQIRVAEARVRAGQLALSEVSQAADVAQERGTPLPAADQSWEVAAVQRELTMIDGRIARMDLRAGIEGQVTWIYRVAGEVVPAGEPVLQVRALGTREVVAFFQPADVVGFEAGDRATIRRATGELLSGELISVGSGPQILPMHLWFNPEFPEYAVPVRLAVDGDVGPDEPVTVRL